MPKEAAHWILAEQTWQAMPEGLLKTEIQGNKALYYLGAIIFDTPYYALTGQNRSNLIAAATRLHGYSASAPFNPFGPLAKSTEVLPEGYGPFVAGALTHVAADAVFHPPIFYFSGNDKDVPANQAARATTRHRRLESALDLHFISQNGNASFRNLRLIDLYQHRENEESAFLKLLNLLYFGKILATNSSLKLTVWQHALIQFLIQQRRIHQFLGLFGILYPRLARRLQPIEALFYATCQESDPRFFQRPLNYRHPLTGEEHTESVSSLQDRTVALALGFLKQIDNAYSQTEFKKRLAEVTFPSLYSGLSPDRSRKMSLFDNLHILDL
ncbi:Zinc dependent phospholipase C [Syntrophus gentianae]|uniref:Zinc dependent phospholipase C n=1 Tax=Syntrophus gentianae TaxID=43775 RepID=A0A1H7UHL9_9BACT|nr:zinc dependent phospholipase C family protein [Syntrophus gentianae]SEL96550.1 Zinc dependent phospholipase C [Syntrophus gentianae]